MLYYVKLGASEFVISAANYTAAEDWAREEVANLFCQLYDFSDEEEDLDVNLMGFYVEKFDEGNFDHIECLEVQSGLPYEI